MTNEEITAALDKLTLGEFVRVVGSTAHTRYRAMRHTTSRASAMLEVSTTCSRIARIVKG